MSQAAVRPMFSAALLIACAVINTSDIGLAASSQLDDPPRPAFPINCSQLDCHVYVDGSADRVCNSSTEAVAAALRHGFEPDVYY